ncbi:Phosphatidylinositol 4-kinase pik1alpha (PI4-kinase)(PtdIns-4-kinase) [Tulasnella sp. 427]|nr:Phosphatidylinositol 4-kinase pik1alpha (PI4-kinase)(PtdIns-4-kinase) [Tulasnella sp. 427]
MIVAQTDPTPEVLNDDAALEDYVKRNLETAHHPIGTASMMPRQYGGVVGPDLKVYGTANLRVADASILPIHFSSHPQLSASTTDRIISTLTNASTIRHPSTQSTQDQVAFMNHALLLRLFLSPSFFSVHVALQYLRLYADNIGISHYLANRLREFSIAELVDVWGFICHLLITRPSQSIALETFVLETAERSTHIAMFTLFNCQASLHDLSPAQRTSPSFAICHRVLNRCQDIIFGDPPPTTITTPYKSPAIIGRPSSRFWKKRVKSHLGPAIAGIGCVLAGAPGMPAMTSVVGKWAVDQGRMATEGVDTSVLDGTEDSASISPIAKTQDLSAFADTPTSQTFDDSDEAEEDSHPPSASIAVPRQVAELLKAAELDDSVRGARTTPELQLFGPKPKSSRTTDPFGQLDHISASSSTPSVPVRSLPPRSASTPAPILSKYDPLYQKQLLRSHYSRSEVNFIQGLESISNRLLVVPKPARVSALRAELMALNNSLPAEMKMKLQPAEVAAITERIMQEMLALEEERMQRMKERADGPSLPMARDTPGGKTAEDESIVRRELNKADPSGESSIFDEPRGGGAD